VNLPGGRRLWSSSTTAPWDIHRQDKTTGSPALSPGSARHSISSRLPSLTRRVNSVTLTPPPENVNIFITQGRKHFDFYLLVVAGNSFPVRRISVPHLIGDAFSIEWQPKLFFYFSEHLHWRNKELKSIQFQNYDQSFELIMTCEKQMPRLAGSIIFGERSLIVAYIE
jgi:hypothetical protein